MPPLADEREAEILARLIRADARRGGPSGKTLVRAHRECCGLRELDVYYRAKPRPPERQPPAQPVLAPRAGQPTQGAYHLRLLESRRGRPLAITIHEYGTERGYVLGTEPRTHASGLSYEFRIEWHPAAATAPLVERGPGWTVFVSYSYLSFGTATRGPSCAQLRQAIAVTDQAALRAPVLGETSDTQAQASCTTSSAAIAPAQSR